jgi:hypothetical protein
VRNNYLDGLKVVLRQFKPSEVQPLGQHFVPPQQLPDEQQMVWLVNGSVHTLAVGQHISLTQIVPLGQQV